MYKILFVTLVLLSASIKAETAVPDSGEKSSVDLVVHNQSPTGNGKCNNRFGMNGWVFDKNCQACYKGSHEVGGKCVDNTDSCVKGKYNTVTKNCGKCKFWYWMTKSKIQGNYCYNRWWMWVIVFFAGFVGLCLIGTIISYLTCCDDCCSKKQSSKSSKGKNGEVNVQNKKPADAKKKASSGCCSCMGGSSTKTKAKKADGYDRGYEKPGFCDCMCCANVCGGCFGACGCTCSKCCRKKDRYVSGYGLSHSGAY